MSLKALTQKEKINISVAFIAIVLMLVGFLFNRVVNNIGFGFAGLYALINISKIRNLWSDKWMWSFIGLALLPFLSDVFNGVDIVLNHRVTMKWLLVLFPAFVFALNADKTAIKVIHWAVLATMLVSSVYSMVHYFINLDDIVASYKVSKVLPVMAKGDHIRISLMTSISILMAMYLFIKEGTKITQVLTVLYILFQILFLHILGAKTGLLSLYVMVFVWVLWSLPRSKKWLIALLFPIAFLFLFGAYKTLPSFQERVNFVRYDFEHYRKGEYQQGLSDAIRVFSIQAGWDIFKNNFWTGVGFSSLGQHTHDWFDKNRPEVSDNNRFIPISQALIYMASAGILGLLLSMYHLFYPLFVATLRKSRWFMAFFIPLILSYFYESHLEGQFPIFVYGFFLSWFWYIARADDDTSMHISNIKKSLAK